MRIKRKELMSQNMFVLLMLLATIVLTSIGYSAMNSITGEIAGKLEAEPQTGVFITNVEYVSNTEANLTTSEIQNYLGTMMNSRVQLSSTNGASEITYKVTVYNNSETSYPFLGVLYDEEFYDNENIIFEIAEEHYSLGEIINPKESKEIYITFKYKNGVVPENTILNSYINFKIAEPNRMVLANYGWSDTQTYLGSTVVKNTIESITFKLGKTAAEGTIAEYSFDASEKQDESIMGYYTDTDSDGLYELTFASNEIIFPNVNGQYLFEYLTNLTSISFDNFSTYGVKGMSYMFYNCESLTSLDLSSFNTSKVTDMRSMFSYCSNLTSLDLSKFDTSKVTDMGSMFYYCSNLTSLDLSKFDTSQVTNMGYMFSYCRSLTSLDLSSFNTSQVTTMYRMFYNCSELTSLDVSKFDTSKVTDMEKMFSYCSSLTSLNLSSFDTSQVTNMKDMFYRCRNLTSLDVSSFDTSKVTDMGSMFSYCSSLTSLDVSKFNTNKVTSMSFMFSSCNNLTSLDLNSFDTSKVTGMGSMFSYCSSLTSLDVSKFNTNKVTSMSSMFSSCNNLTSLDVSSFDTSKVTDMGGMFSYCRSLTNLDLSSFDTSKVTDMEIMFFSCSSLTTIYVSEYDSTAGTGWTTDAVTDSTQMFFSTTKLVGGNGTTYNSSYVDKTYARIDTASTPGYLTNVQDKYYKSPSEIFDIDGTNAEGLHIGDFVNYDAGTWTQEEIDAIQTGEIGNLVTANGSTNLPNEAYQFGGFTAGSSRNENATPNTSLGDATYLKDTSTGEAITGWRVFDVTDNGTITLISAGNPEDYFHSGNEYEYEIEMFYYIDAYISEYILTGNVNLTLEQEYYDVNVKNEFQKRDWSNYINKEQQAEKSMVLTKEILDTWYSKYLGIANADTNNSTTFKQIYSEPYLKYQNIVDNNSVYWLAVGNGSSLYRLATFENGQTNIFGVAIRYKSYGLRVLITLSPDIRLTKTDSKTLTGGNMDTYGGDQTYNVWDIK